MPRHGRGWGIGGGEGRRRNYSPLNTSLLEPALLILINTEPSHGYSLLADLEAFGLSTVHPSVVYRTLREMEDLEWIQSDWDTDQSQGPPRRTYHLIAKGEEALEYWKRELAKANQTIEQLLEKSLSRKI